MHTPLRSFLIVAFFLLLPFAAPADDFPDVSGTDVFDVSNGTVVVSHDTIIDPVNAFSTSGGFENGHTLMRNGGVGSLSFINFDTPEFVTVSGVRLSAKNDQAECCQRRSLSKFSLLADVDSDGEFETLVAESSIDISYENQPGNEAIEPGNLILNLRGESAVTSKHWRIETIQGSDLQPFEGARIVEVDAIECVDEDGDGWGWDGTQSCVIPQQIITACVDEDGDGFGWNGRSTCSPQPSIFERIVTADTMQESIHSWGCYGFELEFYSDGSGSSTSATGASAFAFSVDESKQQLSLNFAGTGLAVAPVRYLDNERLELEIDGEIHNCIFGASGSVVNLINEISNSAEEGEDETVWQCDSGERLLFGNLGNGSYTNKNGSLSFLWRVRESVVLEFIDFIGQGVLSDIEFSNDNDTQLLFANDQKGMEYRCEKIIPGGKLEAPWDGQAAQFLPAPLGSSFTVANLEISNAGSDELDFAVFSSSPQLVVSPVAGVLMPEENINLEVRVVCDAVGSGGSVRVVSGEQVANFNVAFICFDE